MKYEISTIKPINLQCDSIDNSGILYVHRWLNLITDAQDAWVYSDSS